MAPSISEEKTVGDTRWILVMRQYASKSRNSKDLDLLLQMRPRVGVLLYFK